jgi:aminoglycoside phosphotransferase (APT) family kinase protein
MSLAAVSTSSDDRLARQIETLTGGKLVALERQPRWRTAWFAEVARDGRTIPLYIRGDKGLDAETFPGLEREAAILRLFEQGGLPVSHVYGMAHDPEGIVMDRAAGTRDMSRAADAAEAQRVAEEYIEILARMHSLDTAPFVAAGIGQPEGAEAIALVYLEPNEKLYRRLKHTPQPLIEWALRWVRRNVPQDRTRSCVVHGDPGQFLHANGRITCIHDFEATHIGDPIHDLAALRLRHPTEPLGADPDHLVRHYARITGTTVDPRAFSFHTAAFMLSSVMTLAAPMAEPGPNDIQYEYLVWDVMCRRAMLWGIAEFMGVPIPRSAPVAPADRRSSITWRLLEETIKRIDVGGSKLGETDRASALALAQWARVEAAADAAHEAADLDRAATILGTRPGSWREADAALERFVASAGPEHDAMLFDYFARQIEDRFEAAAPDRARLAQYALKPFRG